MPLTNDEILEQWKGKAKRWNIIWILESVFLISFQVFLELGPELDYGTYLRMSTTFLVLTWLFLFISTSLQTDGHDYYKHVLSAIGRWRIHEKQNRKSQIYFFLFSLSYFFMMTYMAHYFTHHFSDIPLGINLKRAGYALYVECFFGLLMGSIPLDVERPKHLFVTFSAFVCLMAGSLLIFVCAVNDLIHWAVITTTSLQLLASLGYIYGYLSGSYPGILQKMSILGSSISVYVAFLVYNPNSIFLV